jgi:hypothetical protein
MDRRVFVSGAFAGGTSLALREVLQTRPAQATEPPQLCAVVEGPIEQALPDLQQLAGDPAFQQFLSDLDPFMQELASLLVPEIPPFEDIKPTPDELKSVRASIDEAVESVLADLPPDQRPNRGDIRQIKKEARDLIRDFLNTSGGELSARTNFTLPLLDQALPVATTVGDSFVLLDLAGPNLLVFSPLAQTNVQDKEALKILVVGAVIIDFLRSVLSVLNFKVPSVKTDKIAPVISKALRAPAAKTAFLNLMRILSTKGATVGEKLAAILDFLKTWWRLGFIKTILEEMLTDVGILDLLLTIAGVAAVFLTGGSSFIVRLSVEAAYLIGKAIAAAVAYNNLQKS